jgi:hypothetical protein
MPKTPEEAIISKYLKNKGAYQNLKASARSSAASIHKPQSNKIRYR